MWLQGEIIHGRSLIQRIDSNQPVPAWEVREWRGGIKEKLQTLFAKHSEIERRYDSIWEDFTRKSGVVQNPPISGYKGAREPPARERRISVRRLSDAGGGQPPPGHACRG